MRYTTKIKYREDYQDTIEKTIHHAAALQVFQLGTDLVSINAGPTTLVLNRNQLVSIVSTDGQQARDESPF